MKGNRIYSEVRGEWDGVSYVMTSADWYESAEPTALMKGEGTAKDQLKLQNKLQQESFNLMKQRQSEVEGSIGKYLSGTEGFNPAQLAALRSQFLNKIASSYQGAGANVRTALARRGSATTDMPAGGDYVRGIASLEGGLASDTASGLQNIDLQNLAQALTNKFNAANLISGQAAQLTSPISTFGSGASNALDQYVWASNQGFGANFMRSLGSGLGSGIAKGVTGGLGSMASQYGGSFGSGFNSGMR